MQFAIHYAELAELDVPVLRVDSSVLGTGYSVCRRVTKYRAQLRKGCEDITYLRIINMYVALF